MLDREEYIEQAHFFVALAERNELGVSTQDLLVVGPCFERGAVELLDALAAKGG